MEKIIRNNVNIDNGNETLVFIMIRYELWVKNLLLHGNRMVDLCSYLRDTLLALPLTFWWFPQTAGSACLLLE